MKLASRLGLLLIVLACSSSWSASAYDNHKRVVRSIGASNGSNVQQEPGHTTMGALPIVMRIDTTASVGSILLEGTVSPTGLIILEVPPMQQTNHRAISKV